MKEEQRVESKVQMGYFEYLGLFLWGIVKSSIIYKLLAKGYRAVSGAWRSSAIVSFTRRDKNDGALRGTVLYRATRAGFSWLEHLGRKMYSSLLAVKESSLFVRLMTYILHNFLALNLRFIGITVFVAAIYPAVRYSPWWCVLLALGGGLCIFDVNVTTYLKQSWLKKLIEALLGTEFSFDYFYTLKTTGSRRYKCAVIFGAAIGAVTAVNPLYGALLGPAVLFVCLVFYKPVVGVFVAAFVAPMLPTMAVVGLCGLTIVAFLAKTLVTKNFKFKFGAIGVLVTSLIILYLVAAINGLAPRKSVGIWLVYAVFMAFYFVIVNTIKTKKQLFDLLTVFVIGGVLVSLYGFVQYRFRINTQQAWMDEEMFESIAMRIYSTLENPNVLGEYLLLVIPVCIGLLWTKKGFLVKAVNLGFTAILTGALILTFSRGCWVGILAAAAIYITFVNGKLWGLLLLLLPVAPMFIPQTMLNRFLSIGDMTDSSTSYRVYIWYGTLNMLKDVWVSGVGMGPEAFNAVYPFYSYSGITAPHSHNLFLQIIVETGIVGLVAFVALCLVYFKKMIVGYSFGDGMSAPGKKAPLSITITAISVAVFGFLLQGLFDNSFYNYRVFGIFWMVIAFGMSAFYIAREERHD